MVPRRKKILFSSILRDLLQDSILNPSKSITWKMEKPGFDKNEHLVINKENQIQTEI
jgi:hypothetical protein